MDFTKMAGQLFQAGSTELTLAASVAFVNLELWMRRRSVRTGRNTAWVHDLTRVLTQILREPLPEFLGNAMLPVEMGCDLGARCGESVLASTTYQGLTLAIYVQIAAGQDGWCRVMIHDDGKCNTATRQAGKRDSTWEPQDDSK
jgi:hypothetical protein